MGMTMTQKILAAHAGQESVSAGQLIRAKLDKPAVLCTSALKNDAGVIGAAVVAAMCAK